MRYVSRPHFTPSMREASFLYKFGKLGIAVHFFNDRSQREEYTGGLKPEDIDKILTAASNGVEWAVALHEKGSADYETERAYNEGKSVPGHYKANGLRAWIDRSHGKLIVETDAFRELRLAEEAKKPQPGVGQPIPGKGKGI